MKAIEYSKSRFNFAVFRDYRDFIFMTIAYFDCFAGIAGDMTLGAFIDCGVPLEKLREGLASLPISGWQINAQLVLKNGIHAIAVSISVNGETDDDELQRIMDQCQREQLQVEKNLHSHEHSHSHHEHDEHPRHEHSHDENHHAHESSHHSHESSHHSHEHSHGRSMREIRKIIESSTLSPRVRENSLKIFEAIARAEAKIHHSTPDDVHFHEIGGVDSLLDICGVAWCLDYLNVEKIYCSALPHSTGHVHCAHGIMPVPAPATLEMLRGVPFFPSGLQGETVTPTGAGILAALAESFGAPPAFTPRLIGSGAGRKNWDDRPNILRIVIGETNDSVESNSSAELSTRLGVLQTQTLQLLETNVDDLNPELWDHVLERIFAAGALDAWLQPIQMKKNRPATTLCALCESASRDAVLTTILRETTTLGVRIREIKRVSLPRTIETVSTKWGEVRVKVARWSEGEIERAAPEYDDVARLAREHKVAAREVYQAAQNAFGM